VGAGASADRAASELLAKPLRHVRLYQCAAPLHMVEDQSTSGLATSASVHLLALPWLLADHVPFPVLGKWPQTFDHAFAVTSTALAWTTSLLPPLKIGLQQEPRGKNAHGKDLCFNFERLQQFCAALSFLYFVISFLWRKHGHLQVLDIVYHLIWSLLRPAYVLLFFVYHLKRVPCLAWLQSFACGVCFFYFLLFSALTETRLTYPGGTRFNNDEELAWTKFGRASTRVEELSFYISMMLFYVHGICSGAWAQGGRRFPSRIALFGFVVFVMVFLADYTHLDQLPWFDAIKKNRFGFVVLYYGLGYLSIVLINTSFFETRLADAVSLHRISLTVVPAERLFVLAQPSQSCISCVRAEPLFRPGKAAVCAMPDLPEQFLAGRFV
jgi:hypothetical protein